MNSVCQPLPVLSVGLTDVCKATDTGSGMYIPNPDVMQRLTEQNTWQILT